MITTLTINYNNAPVPYAEAVIGEYLLKEATADENGVISKDVAEGFKIAAIVAFRSPGDEWHVAGPIVIEAGGNYSLNHNTPL